MRWPLIFLLCLLPARTVLAHATLIEGTPADGSVLATALAEITLHFDEPVDLISIRLIGPTGATVPPLADAVALGAIVRAGYPSALPRGLYLVSYRVTSADSHPVAGTITFTIGNSDVGTSNARTTVATTGNIWAIPSLAVRALYYSALLAAAGGALFRLLVGEFGTTLRRVLAAAGFCAVFLGVLQIGLRGALLADADTEGPFAAPVWRLGLHTTLFASLLVSSVGVFGCTVALPGDGKRWRWLGGLCAAIAVIGFPLSGHTATANPRWLAIASLGCHVAAAMFWVGALWPLRSLLTQRSRSSASVVLTLLRFSGRAVPAVALLVLSGIVLAATRISEPLDLVRTSYGLLLLTKVAALCGLLVCAAWNRFGLTPALAGGQDVRLRLRASILVEITLMAAVLSVTSVLAATSPPHSGHAAPEPIRPRSIELIGGDLHAILTLAPVPGGSSRITAVIEQNGRPLLAPEEVWLSMAQGEAGIAPIRRRLAPDGAGGFSYVGPEIGIAGHWTLELEVLRSDFDQVTLSGSVHIRQ